MRELRAGEVFGFSREYLSVSNISTITGLDGSIVRDRLIEFAKKDKHADIAWASKGHKFSEIPVMTAVAVFGIMPSQLRALDERIAEGRRKMYQYKPMEVSVEIPEAVIAYATAMIEELKQTEDSNNLLGHQRPVPKGRVFHAGEVLKLQRSFQRMGKSRQAYDTVPVEGWAQLIVWVHDKKTFRTSNLSELVEYGIHLIEEHMSREK